jgi:hypothetical protein
VRAVKQTMTAWRTPVVAEALSTEAAVFGPLLRGTLGR